jgi:alkylhydroperoxidase family enzyme
MIKRILQWFLTLWNHRKIIREKQNTITTLEIVNKTLTYKDREIKIVMEKLNEEPIIKHTSKHGIGQLLDYDQELGHHLSRIAEYLLRNSSVHPGLCEAVAAYVSYLNSCYYCYKTHLAAAKNWYINLESLITSGNWRIHEELRVPFLIAADVAANIPVSKYLEAEARAKGYTTKGIHDIVAIASMFCMYNRYVRGMRTPDNLSEFQYNGIGEYLVTRGYA